MIFPSRDGQILSIQVPTCVNKVKITDRLIVVDLIMDIIFRPG